MAKTFGKTVLLLTAGMVLMASGCAPVVIGGAAVTAVAASQERGIKGAISDTDIQAKINNAWFQHDVDMYNRLDMAVYQGRVLLTGMSKDDSQRLDAVRLAWQVEGVQDVINEIAIDDGYTAWDSAQDTWVTTQIETRLTFDSDIKSQNYKTETKGGVVYLLGVARTQAELDRVLGHARAVAHVKRVVSYIKL